MNYGDKWVTIGPNDRAGFCPAAGTEAHFMKQNRTRTALADAYMRLLNDYTIDRITIKMITDAVGCSRKTFYYYFTDIYVLTQYVFELRVQHFLDTNGNFETVREGFLTLASNLSNDRQAILNIYHGYGKEELERFTWETSDYYARQVITRYAQNMDIAPEDLDPTERTENPPTWQITADTPVPRR